MNQKPSDSVEAARQFIAPARALLERLGMAPTEAEIQETAWALSEAYRRGQDAQYIADRTAWAQRFRDEAVDRAIDTTLDDNAALMQELALR